MMYTKRTKLKLAEPRMRVIVICSGPSSMLKKASDTLRRENPGCTITVFTSEVFGESALVCNPDDLFISHEAGRFSLFKTGVEKVKRVRSKRYDAVVLIYNNPLGRECLNLDILALFLGGRVWIFDSEERLYPMRGKRWLLCISPVRFFESVFGLLLFALISPLVLSLFLLLKLFKKKSQSVENLIRYGG